MVSMGALGEEVEGNIEARLAGGKGCWMFCSRELQGTWTDSRALAAATLAIPLISRLAISSDSERLVLAAGGGGWIGWRLERLEETMTEVGGGVGRLDTMGEEGEEGCIDIGIMEVWRWKWLLWGIFQCMVKSLVLHQTHVGIHTSFHGNLAIKENEAKA